MMTAAHAVGEGRIHWCGTAVQAVVISQHTLYCPTCKRMVVAAETRAPEEGR